MRLRLSSDDAHSNRSALTFWILQACPLGLLFRLEGLRQRCELAANVFEEQPLLDYFRHPTLIAQVRKEHRHLRHRPGFTHWLPNTLWVDISINPWYKCSHGIWAVTSTTKNEDGYRH